MALRILTDMLALPKGNNIARTSQRTRWLHAAALLFITVAWPLTPRADVTIEVFHQWDSAGFENLAGSETGGLIRIDGDYQFTLPGVCGMRFHNISSWGWYSENGFLNNLPSNGVPIPVNDNFQYTAPYDGCGANNYIFTTPSTGGGEPAEGSNRLVVQVSSMADVEYLNSSFDPVPEPEWPGEPEVPSVCETFPEICERDYSTCMQLFTGDECESDEQMMQLFITGNQARRAQYYTVAARRYAQMAAIPKGNLSAALTAAKTAATKAKRALERIVDGSISGRGIQLSFAKSAALQCESAITKARTETASSRINPRVSAAVARCRSTLVLVESLIERRHTDAIGRLLKKAKE